MTALSAPQFAINECNPNHVCPQSSMRAGSRRSTLNRPEVHNAFDDHLIAELTHVAAGSEPQRLGPCSGGARRRGQELLGGSRSQLDEARCPLLGGREHSRRRCLGEPDAHAERPHQAHHRTRRAPPSVAASGFWSLAATSPWRTVPRLFAVRGPARADSRRSSVPT